MKSASLVDKVRNLLHDKKPSLADAFDKSFDGRSRTEREQRIELNRYFRYQLGKAPVSTLDERECLIDDIDTGMWLNYFQAHILPTLVRFDLPRG